MARTVTLSSAGTATIVLDPNMRTTSVLISASIASTTAATATIEMSLDDPTTTPAPTLTWAPLSSAVLGSSVTGIAAATYTVLSPVGAVRINSTVGGSSNVWTLKALQSVTA